MKKIKEVKLKKAITSPNGSIKESSTGTFDKKFNQFVFDADDGSKHYFDIVFIISHSDWFDITYEPAFKVGDWVKVVRKVANCKFWINFPMDKAIGNIYKIGCIDNMGNCELKLCNDRYNFPPESLEPAEKPVEKKKVVYEIEYEGDSFISDKDAFEGSVKDFFSSAKNITVKKL